MQSVSGSGSPEYHSVIVGGGIIGCSVALYLRSFYDRVAIVERESDIMRRASYANQARVHNGYHYPRSLLTGLRSRVNFPLFVEEYADCIERDFQKIYAIARRYSKVTAEQFATFCRRIGAPVAPAPRHIRQLFDSRLIEAAFLVEEYAFDAVRLAHRLRERLEQAGVDILLETTAERVRSADAGLLAVESEGRHAGALTARHLYNCTYSRLNDLLSASMLPPLALKHEWTEMALVRVPEPLSGLGVTVMCGPFFSLMPFPPRRLHTLSHVRYTPHFSWQEPGGSPPVTDAASWRTSSFARMIRDARRYLPAAGDVEFVESIWETKTVLPSSEVDDSRPILFRRHHGLRNLTCIMGGKIDNVFDVLTELDLLRRRGELD